MLSLFSDRVPDSAFATMDIVTVVDKILNLSHGRNFGDNQVDNSILWV